MTTTMTTPQRPIMTEDYKQKLLLAPRRHRVASDWHQVNSNGGWKTPVKRLFNDDEASGSSAPEVTGQQMSSKISDQRLNAIPPKLTRPITMEDYIAKLIIILRISIDAKKRHPKRQHRTQRNNNLKALKRPAARRLF